MPKALVTPSLSILVNVDPDNSVAETNEADNSFPASGTPLALPVETASTFRVTLVPVTTNVDGRSANVTAGNKNQFLDAAMRMHPLSAFDAAVGAPLTVDASVPALQSDNGNNSWNTILGQVQARRVSDGSTRYYYGVVNPAYSSGVAGMGYVGFPVAIGWDKLPSGASVAAHEWGHNWDRNHAPCGSAANPDMSFPYTGGTIGVFGYDVAAGVLKQKTSHDLMGYCDNEWISDYTYRAVMQYRSAEARQRELAEPGHPADARRVGTLRERSAGAGARVPGDYAANLAEGRRAPTTSRPARPMGQGCFRWTSRRWRSPTTPTAENTSRSRCRSRRSRTPG